MTITELLIRFEVLVHNSSPTQTVLLAPIMYTEARTWVGALNSGKIDTVPSLIEGQVTSQDLSDLLKYVAKLQNESKR